LREKTNACPNVVGNIGERERVLGRPGRARRYDIKMDIKDVG
jgi:hypothetical protein